MESGDVSDSLQLGELLHKFFNAEPRKLYRNLCVFPFTFAFENHSLSIFRVSNALAAAKTGFSGRLGNRDLRSRELLTAGGKKLCDVVDRTSRLAACGSSLRAVGVGCCVLRTLIFVFIAPMLITVVIAWRCDEDWVGWFAQHILPRCWRVQVR